MPDSLLASGAPAPLAAAVVLLLAALACARGWRPAPWLAAAGAAILAGALAARGLRAGHWPLTGQYEFALAFALSTILATLALLRHENTQPLCTEEPDPYLAEGPEPLLAEDHSPPHRQNSDDRESEIQPLTHPDGQTRISDPDLPPVASEPRGGLREGLPASTLLLATALILYARFLIPAAQQAVRPLPPALNAPWLPLHVGTAALAYGPLAVGGLAGLIWLLRGQERPAAERALGRATAVGYPLLTLSIILGMVWAHVAWGRIWGWDIKEVWTLITWLVYTLYWHVRRRHGWQGRRLAWLALLGLAAVLFTFLGTGWLAREVGLERLHLF